MNTACPHCSADIEIDPATHTALQGHSHFACPACQGAVPVPMIARPRLQLNPAPGSQATSTAQPGNRPPSVATSSRTTNRNLLILGSVALLVLGGLGFFLASRSGGNVSSTKQSTTNQIINNSYFTHLIASGATTEKDLDAVTDIRPYGEGFIGISKEPLTWEQAQILAKHTGADILSIKGTGDASQKELLAWFQKTFSSKLGSTVWVRQVGEARILDGQEVLSVRSLENPRKVALQWRVGQQKPAVETGPWIDLFTGRDVSQWRGSKQETFPDGAWAIEDGSLRNLHGTNDQSLVIRESYRDFELEFEWKFSTGGNSGIFYGQREFQLVDDASHPNGKVPVTSCGALCYFIPPNAKKRIEPAGNYNRGKLVVSGNHVEHWINGEKVVDYELGSLELESIVESGQFKNLPGYKKIDTTAGDTTISLQSHGGNVWFRNIRIRHLGVSSLRNAVLATKHAHPFSGTFPGTIWFVRDSVGDEYYFEFLNNGVLNYEGKSGLRPNGKWRQEGMTVIIDINDGVAKLSGRLDGRKIRGDAQSTTAGHWTWEAVPR